MVEGLFDFIRGLIDVLLPPATAQEDPQVYRWRRTVALALLALIIAQFIHVVLACGLIQGFDTGFARARDLNEVRNNFTLMHEDVLADQLVSAMEKFCDSEKNAQAKRYQRERIILLLREYESASDNKKTFSLPSCDQL